MKGRCFYVIATVAISGDSGSIGAAPDARSYAAIAVSADCGPDALGSIGNRPWQSTFRFGLSIQYWDAAEQKNPSNPLFTSHNLQRVNLRLGFD